MGSSGTLMGAGHYLRMQSAATHLVGVQPADNDDRIDGLRHLASSAAPGIYDRDAVNIAAHVSADEAREMARLLTRREGLVVGISAGAATVTALRITREMSSGLVVAILPDGGFKYASASF